MTLSIPIIFDMATGQRATEFGVEFGDGRRGRQSGRQSGRESEAVVGFVVGAGLEVVFFVTSTLRLVTMMDGNRPILSTSRCD